MMNFPSANHFPTPAPDWGTITGSFLENPDWHWWSFWRPRFLHVPAPVQLQIHATTYAHASDRLSANPIERRANPSLRRLVILGNHMSLWVGRTAKTPIEVTELAELLDAWDKALADVRNARKEFEHISL